MTAAASENESGASAKSDMFLYIIIIICIIRFFLQESGHDSSDTHTHCRRCEYPFPSANLISYLYPVIHPLWFSRAHIIFKVVMIESPLLMAYFSFRLNQRDVVSDLTTAHYHHRWSTGSNLPVETW